MRILSIALKNLNSLRGDHRIDLENGSLGSARLFAITGRTGAGKTTILDAVTLALYGRAARYDKGSPSEMMTRYEVEARAEVVFTHGVGRYAASWDIHRARKQPEGRVMPVKRRIIRETDGAIMAEKNREADAWMEEETGLDYERFLRSILLAQNDFAAFLKADDNERAQLLEKLTGIAVYRELSRLCYDLAREKKQDCDAARNVMGRIQVLSDEERQEREQELDKTRKQAKIDGAHLQALSAVVSWHLQWDRLSKREAALRSREEQWFHAWTDFSEDKQNLDRHELVSDHAAALQQLNEARKEKAILARKITGLENNIAVLKPQIATAIEKREAATDQLRQREVARSELEELTEKVRPLDQQLTTLTERIQTLGREQKATTKIIAKLQSEEALNHRKGKKTQNQLTELQRDLENHRCDRQIVDALPGIRAICARALSIREQFQMERTSVHAAQARLAELHSELNENQVNLVKAKAKIGAVDTQRELLLKEKIDISNDKPAAEWRANLEKSNTQLVKQNERYAVAQRIAAATSECDSILEKIKTETETVAAKRLELVQCRSDLEKQEKLVRLEVAVAEQQDTIKKLRNALETGEACPVCGATEHPHSHELVAQKPDVESETTSQLELTALHQRAADLQAGVVRLDERINGRKKHHHQLAETAVTLTMKMPEGFPVNSIEQQTLLISWQSQITDLETSCATSRESIAAIEKLDLKLEKCAAEREAMERQRSTWRDQRIALETSLHERSARYREAVSAAWTLRADSNEIQNTLTESVQKFVPTETSQLSPGRILDDLEKRAGQYANWLTREKDLKTEYAMIAVEARELGRRQAEVTAQLKKATDEGVILSRDTKRLQIQRTELFGDKLPLQELKTAAKQIAEARDALASAEETHTVLTKKLIADETLWRDLQNRHKTLEGGVEESENQLAQIAVNLGFGNLREFSAALLDSKAVALLRHRQSILEKEKLEFRSGLDDVSREKDSLQNDAILLRIDVVGEGKNSDTLREMIDELEEQRDNKLGREGELKVELRDDDNRKKQQTTDQENLRKLDLEHARWDRLRELIGSADGASFSRFAQGLTLEQLCGEANRHLMSLTDRYALRRSDRESLELEVIDRYQADAVRSLSSLSGGETFLVSLALALALSSLAGDSDTLQSLFIDEGFGTLDSESLETALSALERLHGEDRQIGIISHVELLKERIPVCLHVCASGDGYSSIRVEQK